MQTCMFLVWMTSADIHGMRSGVGSRSMQFWLEWKVIGFTWAFCPQWFVSLHQEWSWTCIKFEAVANDAQLAPLGKCHQLTAGFSSRRICHFCSGAVARKQTSKANYIHGSLWHLTQNFRSWIDLWSGLVQYEDQCTVAKRKARHFSGARACANPSFFAGRRPHLITTRSNAHLAPWNWPWVCYFHHSNQSEITQVMHWECTMKPCMDEASDWF